jgi:hypothetical protein
VIVPRQSVEADFTLTNRERDRSAHLPVDVQAWKRLLRRRDEHLGVVGLQRSDEVVGLSALGHVARFGPGRADIDRELDLPSGRFAGTSEG